MQYPHDVPSRARSLWLAVMPGLFVFLWSTGFIGAKYGLPYAEPFTYLTIRFWLVAALLAAVAWVGGARWPRGGGEIAHLAVAGLLVHGVYLSGAFTSMYLGVETGVSALIVGVQPPLTAALAGPFLGERVTPRGWVGLGLGFVGVVLVVSNKLGLGLGTPGGMAMAGVALMGITLGTLYQKRYCAGMDIRSGGVVQFTAAGVLATLLAFLLESRRVVWTPTFLFARAWGVGRATRLRSCGAVGDAAGGRGTGGSGTRFDLRRSGNAGRLVSRRSLGRSPSVDPAAGGGGA